MPYWVPFFEGYPRLVQLAFFFLPHGLVKQGPVILTGYVGVPNMWGFRQKLSERDKFTLFYISFHKLLDITIIAISVITIKNK